MCRERRTNGGFHIISLNQEKNSIRLGRGSDSDVRISDISVSRCHAIIKHKNTGFYVEDNMSKFGTLIWVRKPIALDILNTLAIQVGRSVMSFNLKKNYSIQPFFFTTDKELKANDKIDHNYQQLLQNTKPEQRTTNQNILLWQNRM